MASHQPTAQTERSVQIAPGRHVTIPESGMAPAGAFNPADLPKIIMSEVIPIGGGDFRMRPIVGEWLTLNTKNLKAIGLVGHETTLRRLMRAGFIRCRALSPSVNQLHLPSLRAHMEAVEQDSEYWDKTVPDPKTGLKVSRLELWRRSL